ncbi:cytochrome P450 [Acrocarpospora catenulata]|uniref:cytochrome P450 n=1 Tax=Acrocarpospora catenulata TaxID=2836182 RepID=UPI001BDB1E97|nr:cytochrome P450 [Acrocarpospora catenulata]
MRDPVNGLAEIGMASGGEIVRLDLGLFRPYLISHPDHVQHVMKGNWSNYRREGMFWKPLERLLGNSILGDGPGWESSRKILQPLFTARYVTALSEDLADTINEGFEALRPHEKSGEPIDTAAEMGRVVNKAVIKVLFGSRISDTDADRVAPAYSTAATSFAFRMLFPSAPYSIRVPGDRRFLDSIKTIDEVMFPVIEQARRERSEGKDIVSALCQSRDEKGAEIGTQQMRDDLVSIYGAASETTGMALTWLWPVLAENPEVEAKLREEIDRVVGRGPVRPAHLPDLTYTKMVLQELLRLYPSGWMLPRMVAETEELGGVRLKAGSQVLISPYATHRLAEFWERPLVFDPERFSPENQERRHRWAYFPFNGGPHVCLGQHLFYIEAPLMVAALMSRYRPVLVNPGTFKPLPAPSVRPGRTVEMALLPLGQA